MMLQSERKAGKALYSLVAWCIEQTLASTHASIKSNAILFSDMTRLTCLRFSLQAFFLASGVSSSPSWGALSFMTRRGTWNHTNRESVREFRMTSDHRERPCQYLS